VKRLLFVLLVTAVLADPASAEKRVALVVGNSAYRSVARLDNPDNDAALMARTLKELGFVLVGGDARTDLDKRALDDAVQAFGHDLQGADVAMFYYAGHGVQVRGANYLVPVDANPTREADVDFQMLDVNVVLNQMQGSGTRLNMIILDACRNNPFGARGLRAASGGLRLRAPAEPALASGASLACGTSPGFARRNLWPSSFVSRSQRASARSGLISVALRYAVSASSSSPCAFKTSPTLSYDTDRSRCHPALPGSEAARRSIIARPSR